MFPVYTSNIRALIKIQDNCLLVYTGNIYYKFIINIEVLFILKNMKERENGQVF